MRKAVAVLNGETGEILELHLLSPDEADPEPVVPDTEGRIRVLLELVDDEAIERAHSGHWAVYLPTRELVELPFKVMVLDAAGVMVDVQELNSSADLLPQHVDLRPHGGECDAEPGRYRWDAEAKQLVPLKRSEVPSAPSGVSIEEAFAQLLEKNPSLKQGDRTMVWLAGYRGSFDAIGRKK